MDVSTPGRITKSDARYGDEVVVIESAADMSGFEKEYLGIAEVGRKFGVTLRTLRFYETRKLIAPLRRGKVRLYLVEDCRRIALVLRLKGFGFTLGEIARMLSAGPAEGGPHAVTLTREKCLDQIRWLQSQRSGIDAAILELQLLVEK